MKSSTLIFTLTEFAIYFSISKYDFCKYNKRCLRISIFRKGINEMTKVLIKMY